MSRADALAASPVAHRLTPGTAFAAWRGITRRQLGATFLLGCALLLYHAVLDIAPRDGAGLALHLVFEQSKAFAMLLAVVVADRITGRDPNRRAVYAVAVLAGAALAGAVIGSFAPLMSARWLGFDVAPSLGFGFYIGLEQVMLGGAAVWVVNDRRRARRARERMHEAEIERIAAERRSIESDLQAMQARVEPQFLFNTLAQVRALYREDAARGERMLDELIAYLRAAMPKMRDSASTLGQELELARAYLAIVEVRLGDRLTVAIDAPADAGSARMPPMLLLPLVDHAVRSAGPGTTRSIAVRGAVAQGTIRVAVAASGGGVAFDPQRADIVEIRDRLAALGGVRASLVLRQHEGGPAEAVLEMPVHGTALVAQ